MTMDFIDMVLVVSLVLIIIISCFVLFYLVYDQVMAEGACHGAGYQDMVRKYNTEIDIDREESWVNCLKVEKAYPNVTTTTGWVRYK